MSIDRYSRSKQRSATAGAADQRRKGFGTVVQPRLIKLSSGHLLQLVLSTSLSGLPPGQGLHRSRLSRSRRRRPRAS
jgi:hypothetical protein